MSNDIDQYQLRDDIITIKIALEALLNTLNISFDELARLLDRTYSAGCSDKERALESFGRTYGKQLRAILADGRTLAELAAEAQIGAPEFWAEKIEKGMK